MEQDKDKSPSRIDTSNLSGDFSSKVSQMVKDYLDNPRQETDTPSWLTISQPKDSAISPTIQKPEILVAGNKSTVNEEIGADNASNLQLQPGQAVPLFNDAFIRRTDLSIQIKDSLKQAIDKSAEATNTSSSAVIESSLRNTFPDSWESDLEKQFHEIHMPREVLSIAREHYSNEASDTYSEIEFSLPDKLLNYVVDNINDRASFISFDEAIEQALEFDFQSASPHPIDHKTHFDHS